MPLFKGTFLLKSVELWLTVSEKCAELWVPPQEMFRIACKIVGNYYTIIIWEKWHYQTEYPNRNELFRPTKAVPQRYS